MTSILGKLFGSTPAPATDAKPATPPAEPAAPATPAAGATRARDSFTEAPSGPKAADEARLRTVLADELKGLSSGTARAVLSSVQTLTAEDTSPQDRLAALVSLGTKLPESAKAVLGKVGIRGDVAYKGLPAAGAILEAIKPDATLQQRAHALETVGRAAKALTSADNVKLRQAFEALEKGGGALRAVGSVLTLVDPNSTMSERAGAAWSLGKVAPQLVADGQAIARFLSNKSGAEILHGAAAAKSLEEAKGVGRLAEQLSPAAREAFDSLIRHLPPDALSVLAKAPDSTAKVLGPALEGLDKAARKMGKSLAQVSETAVKSLGKILPAVGAAMSGTAAYAYVKDAADSSLPANIRKLAASGALLNGADTALGVLEAFGVGLVGTPVNVTLGVAEFAFDLKYEDEKAKYLANPKGYQPPSKWFGFW